MQQNCNFLCKLLINCLLLCSLVCGLYYSLFCLSHSVHFRNYWVLFMHFLNISWTSGNHLSSCTCYLLVLMLRGTNKFKSSSAHSFWCTHVNDLKSFSCGYFLFSKSNNLFILYLLATLKKCISIIAYFLYNFIIKMLSLTIWTLGITDAVYL